MANKKSQRGPYNTQGAQMAALGACAEGPLPADDLVGTEGKKPFLKRLKNLCHFSINKGKTSKTGRWGPGAAGQFSGFNKTSADRPNPNVAGWDQMQFFIALFPAKAVERVFWAELRTGLEEFSRFLPRGIGGTGRPGSLFSGFSKPIRP